MRRGLAAFGLLMLAAQVPAGDGEYLLHAAGCVACHTARDGVPLAGGRAFETPNGIFYSPNITPDADTGIGGWTREEFVRAVREGRAPDGSAYFPVFPYPSYRLMSEQDAGLIYDHLMSVPAVSQANRAHELPWWLGRWTMKPWQWWVLPDATPLPAGDRGRYLVDALGHCGECHTPRNRLGILDASRYLAGTRTGPDDGSVPNITPQRDSGIGRWRADDLVYFLETGALPDGDYTGGSMVDVIEHGTSRLTPADREAIAEYLRRVPPLPGP